MSFARYLPQDSNITMTAFQFNAAILIAKQEEQDRILAILTRAVSASEDLAGIAFPARLKDIMEEIEAPNEH